MSRHSRDRVNDGRLRDLIRDEASRRDAEAAAKAEERAIRRAHERLERLAARPKTDKHGAHGPGAGRLTHRMRMTAHTATGSVLKSFYPWITDPGNRAGGPLIGVELFSRSAFCFSPMELYKANMISSPNGVCIGEIGTGKSSLLKCLPARLDPFGIPFSGVDIKGEYNLLAALLGIEPMRIGPGLGLRLNPLAPIRRHPDQPVEAWLAIMRQRRVHLVAGLLEIQWGRQLTEIERSTIEFGLDSLTGQADPTNEPDRLAPASLPKLLASIARPNDWAHRAEEIAVTPEAMMAGSQDLRLALNRLVTGSLSGMFDSEETENRQLDFRGSTLVNLEAVLHDQNLTVMCMTCAQSAMEAEFSRPDAPPRLVEYDEFWLPARYVSLLRRLQEQFKLARLWGLYNLLAFHRFSDLDAVAAAGSESAQLARGLLADTGYRISYRQVEDNIAETARLMALTDVQRTLLKFLKKGVALYRIGNESAYVVKHQLSPMEHDMVQTDSRMLAQPGVDDLSTEEWEALLDDAIASTL